MIMEGSDVSSCGGGSSSRNPVSNSSWPEAASFCKVLIPNFHAENQNENHPQVFIKIPTLVFWKPGETAGHPSLAELKRVIRQKLVSGIPTVFALRYYDDEGDIVELTDDQDLWNALVSNNGNGNGKHVKFHIVSRSSQNDQKMQAMTEQYGLLLKEDLKEENKTWVTDLEARIASSLEQNQKKDHDATVKSSSKAKPTQGFDKTEEEDDDDAWMKPRIQKLLKNLDSVGNDDNEKSQKTPQLCQQGQQHLEHRLAALEEAQIAISAEVAVLKVAHRKEALDKQRMQAQLDNVLTIFKTKTDAEPTKATTTISNGNEEQPQDLPTTTAANTPDKEQPQDPPTTTATTVQEQWQELRNQLRQWAQPVKRQPLKEVTPTATAAAAAAAQPSKDDEKGRNLNHDVSSSSSSSSSPPLEESREMQSTKQEQEPKYAPTMACGDNGNAKEDSSQATASATNSSRASTASETQQGDPNNKNNKSMPEVSSQGDSDTTATAIPVASFSATSPQPSPDANPPAPPPPPSPGALKEFLDSSIWKEFSDSVQQRQLARNPFKKNNTILANAKNNKIFGFAKRKPKTEGSLPKEDKQAFCGSSKTSPPVTTHLHYCPDCLRLFRPVGQQHCCQACCLPACH